MRNYNFISINKDLLEHSHIDPILYLLTAFAPQWQSSVMGKFANTWAVGYHHGSLAWSLRLSVDCGTGLLSPTWLL